MESLVATKTNGDPLIHDTDYACIEYNQEQSLKYGKDIFSAILLFTTDEQVRITYQALGGDVSFNRQQILDAYNGLDTSDAPIAWEEIKNKPTGYKPLAHLHDIDEVYGFEYILKTLIRIKKAIETTQMPAYHSILNYIEYVIERYRVISDEYLENQMPDYITKFLAGLDKVYFDIHKLQDLTTATELDGENAGKRAFKSSDLVREKFMTLDALVGIKKSLFKSFIEKKFTGIGLTSALYTSPERFTLQQLTNNSTVTLISQQKAREEGIKTDEEVYFDELPDQHEVVIQKLSNNHNNNAGVFLGFNPSQNVFQVGALASPLPADKFSWKGVLNTDRVTGFNDVMEKHIKDYGNPHEVNQEHIGLDLVENLPVVDKEDMMAVRSVHKYLTFDALIFFMRAFLLQNGKSHAITEASKNKFIIDNCVVVFTPAGIACKTKCDVAPSPPQQLNFSKISQACMEGEFYLPPEASADGYSEPMGLSDLYLSGTYDIGTSTQLVQAIKHFSQCCGYEELTADFYPSFSNSTGWLSETSISNIPDGSYYTIEVTYPFATNNVIRVSGVYPESYFSFKTGYELGTVNFEVKNKYFLTKTATYTEVVDDDESYDPNNFDTKIFLYVDRKYIYTGKVANVEVYIDRHITSPQLTYNLKWRRKESWDVITPAGFPTVMTAANASQRFIKAEFTIPFTEEYNDDSLVVEIDYLNSSNDPETVFSNYITVVGLKSTKVTKTLPLYENGVQNGEIVISRENETGRITIENIVLPTAQNTSHVYFLRSGSGSAAPVTGVIDVWSDLNQVEEEWEFPIPMIDYDGSGNPTPPLTSSAPQVTH